MLAVSLPPGGSAGRSSLEVMLNSIRRRDEKPKDVPPALPTRPVSKARLPTSKRILPNNFKVDDSAPENIQNEIGEKDGKKRDRKDSEDDEKELGYKVGVLGSGKMLKVEKVLPAQSPYVNKVDKDKDMCEENKESNLANGPSSLGLLVEESEWGQNIRSILNKWHATCLWCEVMLLCPCFVLMLGVNFHTTEVKLRVWCRLPDGQWVSGKTQSSSGEDALVMLSDEKIVTVPIDNILPANPDILEGVDDLIQLSYLNEPSVLHNLQYRYSHNMIYTKAGPVLVAINPFKDLQIYGDEFVMGYKQKLMDSPHVYGIADTAFSEMMRGPGFMLNFYNSGESGAGKTETAKIAMQYLAALGGRNGIENEILQTNCILEAFGNAKTSRNDNSSRFGKLIEIHFTTTGKICGAKIQTFLLEKSRVVQLAKGERSYHAFYQLCAGAPSYLKERLNLKMAGEYHYLKQSDCLTVNDVDDARRFHLLMEALDIVQLCKDDQESTFAMLATVLWMGNISFQVIDNENHVQVVEDEAAISTAKLMGCNVQDLMLALSSRQIRAGNDSIVQNLTLPQAIDSRDALAKTIYASLFDWLVEQINKSLEVGKRCTGRSISILDIYGFESFQRNSFEQFCINYANERLQQHFNKHLFKLEQEEYAKDGIDWTKVDFEDNQECLNLFEKESTFPKATDLTFANKLKQHLSVNPCFKGERGGAFGVCHYAGQKPLSPLSRLGAIDSQKQSVAAKFKEPCRDNFPPPIIVNCLQPIEREFKPKIDILELIMEPEVCLEWIATIKNVVAYQNTSEDHKLYGKLQNLKQESKFVQAYTESFYRLQSRCNLPESEEVLIRRYMHGLRGDIHYDLVHVRINTLEEAYSFASESEKKMSYLSSMSSYKATPIGPKGIVKCYSCGQEGHVQANCSKKPVLTINVETSQLETKEELQGYTSDGILTPADTGSPMLMAHVSPIAESTHGNVFRQSATLYNPLASKTCSAHVVLDNGSSISLISRCMVNTLGLTIMVHCRPRKVHSFRVRDFEELAETVRVGVHMRDFSDYVFCHVSSLDACVLVLGTTWQYRVRAVYCAWEQTYRISQGRCVFTLQESFIDSDEDEYSDEGYSHQNKYADPETYYPSQQHLIVELLSCFDPQLPPMRNLDFDFSNSRNPDNQYHQHGVDQSSRYRSIFYRQPQQCTHAWVAAPTPQTHRHHEHQQACAPSASDCFNQAAAAMDFVSNEINPQPSSSSPQLDFYTSNQIEITSQECHHESLILGRQQHLGSALPDQKHSQSTPSLPLVQLQNCDLDFCQRDEKKLKDSDVEISTSMIVKNEKNKESLKELMRGATACTEEDISSSQAHYSPPIQVENTDFKRREDNVETNPSPPLSPLPHHHHAEHLLAPVVLSQLAIVAHVAVAQDEEKKDSLAKKDETNMKQWPFDIVGLGIQPMLVMISKGVEHQPANKELLPQGQLFKLMQWLETTTPHFIRCVKPNSKQHPGMYDNDLVLQQLRCCGVLEVVRISRSGFPTRMTHQQFSRRYRFLLFENVLPEDPLSISVAILQQFNIHPDMYQIAALEDARKGLLNGVVMVQKCFRGHQARSHFYDLKRTISILQSLIRCQNARKEYQLLINRRRAAFLIQKHLKKHIARRTLADRQKAVTYLQSATRGWLIRRNIYKMKKHDNSNSDNRKFGKEPNISGLKKSVEHVLVHSSVLEELQMRVLKAEAALGQKEEENSLLQQRVKQLETRWSEYEEKMKSMEETWQKQMTSLQVSLAAAKKSLAAGGTTNVNGEFDASPLRHDYDSEDTMSVGTHTPEESTPAKLSNHTSNSPAGQESNFACSAVSHLVNEFEQRKRVFSDDAKFLIEVKSGQSASTLNPTDELRKLRLNFEAWKKDYKTKLRETKAALQKLGNAESNRTRKKWWGKRTARGV
ncbi:hypothetical protein IFM89_035815 [Coptis chinensis]|uniref:Uncharacterized protein n=1 Tax=Coptis chinensis TaxID=261450 RepID=A0A835LY38_9MAGN|nr:hypothetical protein IFM89_035815 [Coptis chinensis]